MTPAPDTGLQSEVTALKNVITVEARIREASAKWKRYGNAVSIAYSQAWNEQGETLRQVNENLERMRKQEEAALSLALTILTVGVAGPIASSVAKGVITKGAANVSKDLEEIWKDGASDLAKKGAEAATERVSKFFEAPSQKDAFAPSGIPPDQYGYGIQGGIEEMTGILEGSVVQFLTAGALNAAESRKLSDKILNTDFIKNTPNVPDGDGFRRRLKNRASLALWLAWGWARDSGYWKMRSGSGVAMTPLGKEVAAYEPIRKVLVEQLGIVQANQEGYTPFGNVKLIDLYGFIQWSLSSAARTALFSGLPSHPKGRAYVEAQMQSQIIQMFLRTAGYLPADG